MPTRWCYTVFGEVISGFEIVDSIGQSATQTYQDLQDVPVAPIIILEAKKLISENNR